jgi:hypothetical protein
MKESLVAISMLLVTLAPSITLHSSVLGRLVLTRWDYYCSHQLGHNGQVCYLSAITSDATAWPPYLSAARACMALLVSQRCVHPALYAVVCSIMLHATVTASVLAYRAAQWRRYMKTCPTTMHSRHPATLAQHRQAAPGSTMCLAQQHAENQAGTPGCI